MNRVRQLLLALIALGLLAGTPAAGAATGPLSVTVDRTAISTRLGHRFSVRTTFLNRGSGAAAGLIAHLNVLSVRPGVYVDPEDWSSQRTRYLRPIPAGGSSAVGWSLQAVNAGDFAVYVAVLSNDGRTLLATSPPLRLEVGDRRTLDGGGVLPLVIGMPAALGLAWIGVRARRRRAGQVTRSETNSPAVTRP